MSKFREIHNPYLYSSITNNRSTNLYNQLNPYYSNLNSHYFSPHEQISHYNPQFLNQQKIINPLSTYTSYSKEPSPFHMGQISNSCEQDYQFKKRQNPFYRAHLLRYNQNQQSSNYKTQQDKYQQYRYKENQQSFILPPLSQEERQYNLKNYHKSDLANGLVQLANQKLKDRQEDQRLNYHKSDMAKGLFDFASNKYQQQREIQQRQNYHKTDLARGLTRFADKINKDRREQQERQNYYKNDISKGLLNFANNKYQENYQQQQGQNLQRGTLYKGLTDFANDKYKKQKQYEQQQKNNYHKSDLAKGLTDFANTKYKNQKEQQQQKSYYNNISKGLINFAKTKNNDQTQKSQLTKKSSIIEKIDQKQFGSFGKGKNNNLKLRINQNMKNGSPQVSQVENGYKYFVDSDQDRQSANFVSYASQKKYPAKISVRGKTYNKIQLD